MCRVIHLICAFKCSFCLLCSSQGLPRQKSHSNHGWYHTRAYMMPLLTLRWIEFLSIVQPAGSAQTWITCNASLHISIKFATVNRLFTSDAHGGVRVILVYRAAHRLCPDRRNMHDVLSTLLKRFRVVLVNAQFLSIVQPAGSAQTGMTCIAGRKQETSLQHIHVIVLFAASFLWIATYTRYFKWR